MEKLKFPWGELIIVSTTKELSVGMDIITPGSTPDEPGTYLKKGVAIYYVIDGKGLFQNKPIKRGDLIKIKAGQKMFLKNNSRKNLKILCVYLPPYDDANIGHKNQ
ncbi:hypothetical protein COW80_01540 [Candidatus Beckwithbacteria bacterium CG22_combo_CG10-13_8_21_14_all_01_47_9]|uniref:Cupin 2 conserved barrel domain-containing protein n=1 Tax=Candidatus Beckwithbacteria bacterium CG22_combo_CG10-13_8_21_14_all_01_47_9 TaxID=1974496 RepID=A0A2H0E267_9BACT|nr:MAG: hypothetical protein COW80_01540 [Candidatus Beckwithbacteria bacterium CG22_combo_CG10-13_8_21_14_all_01_47_9]